MPKHVDDESQQAARPDAVPTDSAPQEGGREQMRKMAESDKRRSVGRRRSGTFKKASRT